VNRSYLQPLDIRREPYWIDSEFTTLHVRGDRRRAFNFETDREPFVADTTVRGPSALRWTVRCGRAVSPCAAVTDPTPGGTMGPWSKWPHNIEGMIGFDIGRRSGRSEPWSPEPR